MIETVDWQTFQQRFRWKQGEHVAIVAPTGAGKTTLMKSLIPLRKYNIFFGTKPDDPLYRELQRKGFERVSDIADVKPWMNNVLLWPSYTGSIATTYALQERTFKRALDRVVSQESWTLWLDECKYMAEQLHMVRPLTFALEQLRSINGTTISGAQRPVWLPKSVLANSSHAFLWKTTDADDLRRLSDIGGVDRKLLATEMHTLGKHEWIYIHTRGTETKMLRSQVK